jgi:hypothetical protein
MFDLLYLQYPHPLQYANNSCQDNVLYSDTDTLICNQEEKMISACVSMLLWSAPWMLLETFQTEATCSVIVIPEGHDDGTESKGCKGSKSGASLRLVMCQMITQPMAPKDPRAAKTAVLLIMILR